MFVSLRAAPATRRLCFTGFYRLKLALVKWTRHGNTSLLIPGYDPPIDITIFMDISRNPGPQELNFDQDYSQASAINLHGNNTSILTYSRESLFIIRCQPSCRPDPSTLQSLKLAGLLRFRGRRAGRRRIPVVVSERLNYIHRYKNPLRDRNLVDIPIVLEQGERAMVNRNHLKFCVWNAQSIRNKSACFSDYICDRGIDLIALTETWFTDNDSAAKVECTPDGYKMFDYSRSGRKGGGIALVYRSEFTVKKISYCERSSFEMSEWTLKGEQSSRMRLSVIYRPPYSAKHPVTTGVFISEFAEYLESFVLCTEPVLICGDFNIHVDNPADPDGEAFCDLLASMGLKQHVDTPTQIHGHTLDLIITRTTDSIVVDRPMADSFLSDHATVTCHLKMAKADLSIKTVSYRKTKSIDLDLFKTDICASNLSLDAPTTLNTLVNYYNTTMTSILDMHAPLCTKTRDLRH